MLSNIYPHLNKGSKADSCLSRVCITQVFLNFVSSVMASSFSDTTSAEKVFFMNFSKGFLKSIPSDRFNGRIIQPAIILSVKQFFFSRSFRFLTIRTKLWDIFRSLQLWKPVPRGWMSSVFGVCFQRAQNKILGQNGEIKIINIHGVIAAPP